MHEVPHEIVGLTAYLVLAAPFAPVRGSLCSCHVCWFADEKEEIDFEIRMKSLDGVCYKW